jgi:hypothetical protein
VELLAEGADILHALTKASSNLDIELHLARQKPYGDDVLSKDGLINQTWEMPEFVKTQRDK